MAEYSQRLSPSCQPQVHELRTENPLKSAAYYRTQERSLIDELGRRKQLIPALSYPLLQIKDIIKGIYMLKKTDKTICQRSVQRPSRAKSSNCATKFGQ